MRHVATLAALCAAFLLAGCNSLFTDGPSFPAGVRGEAQAEGTITAQAFAKDLLSGEYQPVTERYYVTGQATVLTQWPETPHLIIDLAHDSNVTSRAGSSEVDAGLVLIRRHGARSASCAPQVSYDPCTPSVPAVPVSAPECGCEPVSVSLEQDCPPVYVSPCGGETPVLFQSNPHNTLCKGLPVAPFGGECVKTFERLFGGVR